MPTVQYDVSMPKLRGESGKYEAEFKKLDKKNASMFFDHKKFLGAFQKFKKRNPDMQFATRTVSEHKKRGIRIWRLK